MFNLQYRLHLTLKMASAQVVEMSVANNSPSQDSNHPDLFQSRYVTPGFKPFSYLQILMKFPHKTQLFFIHFRNSKIVVTLCQLVAQHHCMTSCGILSCVMFIMIITTLTRNGNRTEWSTIHGVIGRVISNHARATRSADLKLRLRSPITN